jgi:hypothetical protein
MTTPMKKVLFIAYFFPPIGGSGVQRPAKFVKYLPEFGWQPYVITTDQPYADQGWDETLLAEVAADAKIWRVPTPRPQPANRLAAWVGWRPSAPPQPGAAAVASRAAPVQGRLPLRKRLRKMALSPLYVVQDPPLDPAFFWSLKAVSLARRIIRAEQIDAVITTAPPWSPLFAGRLLQMLTGKPWIADFRDPWTDNTFIYFPTPARRSFDQRIERAVLAHADAVVSVTEPCVEGLKDKIDGKTGTRPFVLIPNGWDQADLPELPAIQAGLPPPTAPDGRVVLLHPGSIYQGEPLPLLAALDRLAEEGIALDRLHFHFIGFMHPADRQAIAASPHARLFRLDHQRVLHHEALRLMRNAHVLLLLLGRLPDVLSGKIFEYMVSGRPVLAIAAKEGVAGQMVRACGIGRAVDAENVDGLALAIRQIAGDYGGFTRDNYRPDWSAIGEYERCKLTSKLAETLDQVLCRQ